MTALETVALYYDAGQNKHGDFSEMPLADDFEFTGPVASFDSAEGYRAMAREAGQAVTSFHVRRQVDGNAVCSIIDWEMTASPSRISRSRSPHSSVTVPIQPRSRVCARSS